MLGLVLWPVYCPDPGNKRDMGGGESAGSAFAIIQVGGGRYRLLLLLLHCGRYYLSTAYCYDFSTLKAHDLAKLSKICRSVQSKARAKGLWGMPRVLPEYPTEAVRTIKMLYSSISAIYGDSLKPGFTIP